MLRATAPAPSFCASHESQKPGTAACYASLRSVYVDEPLSTYTDRRAAS